MAFVGLAVALAVNRAVPCRSFLYLVTLVLLFVQRSVCSLA